ncbi:MAG: hypothetical protein RQ745_02980 [Longimicrobiales bacterium]|nr:hypothetical protein [Longimicrobiales bacterium]
MVTILPKQEEVILPPVLGKDSVVVGDIIFGCNNWSAGVAPLQDQLVVDVFFGRSGPSEPDDRPLPDQLAQIPSLGGRVLHQFNFPAARAVLPTRSIPELDANHVREVPFGDRFDWSVGVGLRRALEPGDTILFRSLGGEPGDVLLEGTMFFGRLPDDGIAELRTHPQIAWVDANGIFCLAGSSEG